MTVYLLCVFFFFNDTATTEIYTLSLHDALPISDPERRVVAHPGVSSKISASSAGIWGSGWCRTVTPPSPVGSQMRLDRKSTRLNSSHANISYAVFCLKKKTTNPILHALRPHDSN